MKKNYILSPVLLLLAFVFASCEKDNQLEDGLIPIYCEPLGNSTKVSVIDDVKSRWVEGDEISINGQTTQVLFSNGQACVHYTADANSVNRAVYPASMVGEGTSFASDEIDVTFPAEYHYREADGHQQIEIPMVAKSTGTDALEFKHLTGALCVQLYNNSGAEVLVRSVTIASDNSQLSGPCTVDVYTAAITTRVAEPTTAQKKVTLHFDHGLKVTNGNTRKVLIPVLPVGDGNHFTVTVDFCQPSELSHAFRFTKTQSSGGALARNILGYAKTELSTEVSSVISHTALIEWEENHYNVYTPLDFYLLVQAINDQSATDDFASHQYYYMYNISIQRDIDMTGDTITPIKDHYRGVISGNGYTIGDLTIRSVKESASSTNYCCSLFSRNYINVAQISNVTLKNLTLLHQGNNCSALTFGAIYAKVDNAMTISNCQVNIKSIKTTSSSTQIYFGGFIGELLYSAQNTPLDVTFNNCNVSIKESDIECNGRIFFGNFIGYADSKYNTEFNSCRSEGNVTLKALSSSVIIGGFIGQKSNNDFVATNCSIRDTVSATVGTNYSYGGKIVGRYYNQGSIDVENNNTFSLLYRINGREITPSQYSDENMPLSL
jgi:hypothetical protein